MLKWSFNILWLIACMLLAVSVSATEYHVSVDGDDKSAGTKLAPFRTIGKAALVVKPGDVVTVHKGIYREAVSPSVPGLAGKPITFRSAQGEKVEIRGSEVVASWIDSGKGVWRKDVGKAFGRIFTGDYNPFEEKIYGDWFFPQKVKMHTGQVYLNGTALREDAEEAFSDLTRIGGVGLRPGFWRVLASEHHTEIYANFGDLDPNKALVEINARPYCFYPAKTGINYITVRGFIMKHAATQWAAPTAEQVGLIGTNWSKGWIIEDNTISDSRCVGITLGKDRASGHNVWSADMEKDGSVHYNEMIVRVIAAGWNKETIGSHIVRRNKIFNCGAAGICGSFGAAYSQILNNEISNVYTVRDYYGAEMAGIKFHGAIDMLIKGNTVRNSFIGLWLDWMAQGTKVVENTFEQNDYVDFFPEVNHGPYLVENNKFLSVFSLKDWSENGVYKNNIFAGLLSRAPQERETPIFKPHLTEMVVVKPIVGGGNTFIGNTFKAIPGQVPLRPKMHTMDEEDKLIGNDLSIYKGAALPVAERGNRFLGLKK